MLTIHYGAAAETLYQRRPCGTVRAYLLQQRLDGPAIYQNPGRQDLTADVNFTDLQNWSQPWVSAQQVMSFGEFLTRSPDGLGQAFLVLDQAR
jgi:SAM-dependent MidA family methyltransferase